MRNWKVTLTLIVAFAGATGAFAQDTPSALKDLVGARGTAIDQLQQRGYTNVRGMQEGGASYTYWTENTTGRCVIARTEDGRLASIIYAPNAECVGGQAHTGGSEGKVNTVCGVITGGQTYRYRCEAVDKVVEGGHKVTVLNYPDQKVTLHWLQGKEVGVEREGMNTVQATFSTSEGETDIVVGDMTYFYISDKNAAAMELKNFKN